MKEVSDARRAGDRDSKTTIIAETKLLVIQSTVL